MNPTEFETFSSMISNTDKMFNFEDFADMSNEHNEVAVPDVNETTPFEAEIDDLLLSAYGTGLMKQRSRERLGIPPPLQHTNSFDSLINVLKSLPDDVDESAEDEQSEDAQQPPQQFQQRDLPRSHLRTSMSSKVHASHAPTEQDMQTFSIPSLAGAYPQATPFAMQPHDRIRVQMAPAYHAPMPPRHNPPPAGIHPMLGTGTQHFGVHPPQLSMRSMSEPVAPAGPPMQMPPLPPGMAGVPPALFQPPMANGFKMSAKELARNVKNLQDKLLNGGQLAPGFPTLPKVNRLDELFSHLQSPKPMQGRQLPNSFFDENQQRYGVEIKSNRRLAPSSSSASSLQPFQFDDSENSTDNGAYTFDFTFAPTPTSTTPQRKSKLTTSCSDGSAIANMGGSRWGGEELHQETHESKTDVFFPPPLLKGGSFTFKPKRRRVASEGDADDVIDESCFDFLNGPTDSPTHANTSGDKDFFASFFNQGTGTTDDATPMPLDPIDNLEQDEYSNLLQAFTSNTDDE